MRPMTCGHRADYNFSLAGKRGAGVIDGDDGLDVDSMVIVEVKGGRFVQAK